MIKKLKRGYRRIMSSSESDAVLVYQMGKVGSTSLTASIEGAVHLHTLYANPPCKELLKLERATLPMKVLGFFYDLIRQYAVKLRKEVKIITVIRTPVERNVSMFFQDLPYWYVKYKRSNPDVSRFSNGGDIEAMYEDVFPHSYPDEWFDKEIKRLTGCLLYTSPSPRD